MDITATYQASATELAKASSLFIEKKRFLMFAVWAMNILGGLLIIAMVTKLFMVGLNLSEWGVLVGALLWIFGRRPFNEWLLLKKMRASKVSDKSITVTFSLNGIVWSGEALKNGNLSWAHIPYVMIAQNGLVIPQGATQFLWVPFRAFPDQSAIDNLTHVMQEHRILIRKYPQWRC